MRVHAARYHARRSQRPRWREDTVLADIAALSGVYLIEALYHSQGRVIITPRMMGRRRTLRACGMGRYLATIGVA